MSTRTIHPLPTARGCAPDGVPALGGVPDAVAGEERPRASEKGLGACWGSPIRSFLKGRFWGSILVCRAQKFMNRLGNQRGKWMTVIPKWSPRIHMTLIHEDSLGIKMANSSHRSSATITLRRWFLLGLRTTGSAGTGSVVCVCVSFFRKPLWQRQKEHAHDSLGQGPKVLSDTFPVVRIGLELAG